MQNTRAHSGGSCGRYNHPDIIITENGVCLPGEADAALPGVLNDVKRIEFLRDYVQSAMQAIKVDKVCMHCSNFGEKPIETNFHSEQQPAEGVVTLEVGVRRSRFWDTIYGVSTTTGNGRHLAPIPSGSYM